MSKKQVDINRATWVVTGTVFIILSFVILGMAIWEGFRGVKDNYFNVTLPGFHELSLKSPGLYVGVYQGQDQTPMPVDTLANLEIRMFEKYTYSEVPIQLNRGGQTFNRLGQSGMFVFNFVIERPGDYTMSGFYMGEDEAEVKPVPIYIFAEAARDIKQTLAVGIAFFILFLVLGIMMCVRGGKEKKVLPKTPSKEKKSKKSRLKKKS